MTYTHRDSINSLPNNLNPYLKRIFMIDWILIIFFTCVFIACRFLQFRWFFWATVLTARVITCFFPGQARKLILDAWCQSFRFPLQLIPWVKILSTFADISFRRNDMTIPYLILGITLVYVVTVIIIYLKSKRSERFRLPPLG